MTSAKIIELFERLARLSKATKEKEGGSTSWTYTFPDGETHRYVLTGLKSHAEMKDAALNLLIWIWCAKDYLKELAKANGKSGTLVEQAIDNDPDLSICLDLANLAKHAILRESRSRLFPYFGPNVIFSIPLEAIGSITYTANEFHTDVAHSSLATVTLPVFDQAGNEIGDAFVYAERGITALEQIRRMIET
jgi:hypothetical protein